MDAVRCDAYNDDPLRVSRVWARMHEGQHQRKLQAALYSALAHDARLAVLEALSIEPLCVCELSTLLDMSAPAVMHHLRQLAKVGLIEVEKKGKFAEYRLTASGRTAPVQRSAHEREAAL